jgi:AraC-like DNA-binding protein
VASQPIERHLLRAKDLMDNRYAEAIELEDVARAAGLSKAHFSRLFKTAYGETPHAYLLTRRLERAAALLRNTDHTVADICMEVGLTSVGSFTTSFKRMFGLTPTAYRAAYPLVADRTALPNCVVRFYGRPQRVPLRGSTFREASTDGAP